MLEVSAAIIVSNDKILITKRGASKSLANLWEFPGGKVEANESYEDCVVREIKEELNINITVNQYYATNEHQYEFGTIKLIAFIAELESGTIELTEHTDFAWVSLHELKNYEFAPADIPIIKKLEEDSIWDLIRV